MESTLHAIAWTQAEVGDIEAGLVTAQQTQVGSSRDLILALIARAQAQAGAVTSARETAATITDRTWHPWALWQIGTVQIHAGNVWDGMETIAGIPDPVARAKALLWAALTPAASGDRVTAAILLDQALTEISSIDGKNVDPEVFQRACVIRAQTGDLWGGLRMARGIEDEWARADAMWRLASIQTESGDWSSALAWAREETSPLVRGYALLGVASELLSDSQ